MLVTHALDAAQGHGWDAHVQHMLRSRGDHDFLIVERKWDETPIKLSFGPMLAQTLSEWAIKRLQNRVGMSDEEKNILMNEINIKGQATCRVLIHKLSATWGSGAEESTTFVLKPQVIQRNTATCMEDALNKSFPPLSNNMLFWLAGCVRWLALVLVKDAFPANKLMVKRLLHAMSRSSSTGMLLVVDVECCVHSAFGCLRTVLTHGQHLSSLYSASCLLHLTDIMVRLMQAMLEVIMDELEYTYNPQWNNPYQAELDAVLERTWFRNRSMREERMNLFTPEARHKRQCTESHDAHKEEVANECRQLLNGQISKGHLKHVCKGRKCCSGGRMTAVVRIFRLLCTMLLQCIPQYLAFSKWDSVQEHCRWWDLGISLHAIIPRAWMRAWPTDSSEFHLGLQRDADEHDFHVIVSKRLRNTSLWIGKAITWFTLVTINIVCRVVDAFIWLIAAAADVCDSESELLQPLIVSLVRPDGPAHAILRDCTNMLKQMDPCTSILP